MTTYTCHNCLEEFESKRKKNLCKDCKMLKAEGKWDEYEARRKVGYSKPGWRDRLWNIYAQMLLNNTYNKKNGGVVK